CSRPWSPSDCSGGGRTCSSVSAPALRCTWGWRRCSPAEPAPPRSRCSLTVATGDRAEHHPFGVGQVVLQQGGGFAGPVSDEAVEELPVASDERLVQSLHVGQFEEGQP